MLMSTVISIFSASPDVFSRSLARGPVYAALTAFIGGILACFTPCVYPMIAITVSVFGARQARSRAHAVGLSTAFVAGLSSMFTPLGVGAALTGTLFGSALADPRVLILVALVFGALSLSMFGAIDWVLPSWLSNRLASIGGAGYGGAFLILLRGSWPKKVACANREHELRAG